MSFKQAPHKLLVIPGPIEVADPVLYANAHPSMSHVSPDFIPYFGDCVRMTRQVLFTKTGQPFLISGSGTLGWDQVGANLVEAGDKVLVLHTGYFGDSFADCLEHYGAEVKQIKAPIGGVPDLDQVKAELSKENYKIVTFTHVDTSTGVLSPAKEIAKAVKEASPKTLVVMDAVCSVASEEILFDDWSLDVVLTASQKGLGAPPGLSILVASQDALKVWQERKTREGGYYVSWKKWLPIMKAYESGSAAYFATPPVNLIYAFHASLALITGASGNAGELSSDADAAKALQSRFASHRAASNLIKSTGTSLGLSLVPLSPSVAANGMSAFYYPTSYSAPTVLGEFGKRGVVVAGGLHKDVKDLYFRVGHMGVSVVGRPGEEEGVDVNRVVEVLKEVFTSK